MGLWCRVLRSGVPPMFLTRPFPDAGPLLGTTELATLAERRYVYLREDLLEWLRSR
jgi:hypothetical protein